MTTTDPMTDINSTQGPDETGLLVVLAAMPVEQVQTTVSDLAGLFSSEGLLIAAPDSLPADSYPDLRIVSTPGTSISWTLTAADFVNAYQIADKNKARAILILGPESGSFGPGSFRNLANAALNDSIDLAVPYYNLSPYASLVNSAILYPLTRALFSSRVRFPLAGKCGLSLRMAERLATAGQRLTMVNQAETPLWPINEAAVAGFNVEQFDAGPRMRAQTSGADLNTILPLVTGALFSDIDAKASFWQRPRVLPPARSLMPQPVSLGPDPVPDIAPMISAFRLGYTNLYEVWSLVLPPNSLLGLKRLFAMDSAQFRMPDSLWARILFDFLLAHRLRTINRGHLLGALIPLYLAWVASHINITASGTDPQSHIEAVAEAFEADKPYLVARWRWPDRFNP
jgi:hypothetical protein